MTIVLYDTPTSNPCRAVKMTADHLGIPLEIKVLFLVGDWMKGEQKKPEFLAKNPLGLVPVIEDDGFCLWESRAIMTYLVNKYAPESPLYPKEPKARAVVERMLYFDFGIFIGIRDCVGAVIFGNLPAAPEEKVKDLKQSLRILENILETTTYTAGNHLTLADYSILSNLVFMEEVLDFNLDEYPKISAWVQRMKKETPKYKEINEKPLKDFKEVFNTKKSQKAANS